MSCLMEKLWKKNPLNKNLDLKTFFGPRQSPKQSKAESKTVQTKFGCRKF